MNPNNAAQPGLTDELSIAINMLISDAKALAHVKAKGYDASDAERCFQVAHDRVCALLTKLRAEGVQAGDEREAFIAWLTGSYPNAYSEPEAVRLWHHKHVSALAWQRRAALASAPVAESYDSEKRCRSYYDSDLRPFATDGLTYNVWQAVWHAAQFDRAMTPDSSKPRQHSAPVAGEAQPLGYVAEWCSTNKHDGRISVCGRSRITTRHQAELTAKQWAEKSPQWGPMRVTAVYAAPQASEAVRPDVDAVDLARVGMELHSEGMPEHTVCAELVRLADALKSHPQADKEGGQQRAGDGDEPIAWESTTPAYIKFITDSRYRKFSPAVRKWYRPYLCANCAALSATQTEQGERDA